MKEDLKNIQNQNTKTECSMLEMMVLVTITQPREEKFFVDR